MLYNELRAEVFRRFRSQSAFAEAIDWHPSKVSRMLAGRYTPDIEEAAAIALTLGLGLHAFTHIFLPDTSPNGENTRETDTDAARQGWEEPFADGGRRMQDEGKDGRPAGEYGQSNGRDGRKTGEEKRHE